MNLTEVHNVRVKRRYRWRVGRGESSGSGKTCGRGSKGQKSRAGVSFRPYFEGGQMPIVRRIPKRGFNNPFRKRYALVNISRLNIFNDGDVIDPQTLMAHRLVRKLIDGVKILGDGELQRRLTVKAHKFSKAAVEKIQKAGGKIELITR
jgi:large subunit ribosomal protein L15